LQAGCEACNFTRRLHPSGEIEEQLQLAFQQGAEYAVGVMRQQAAEEGSKGAGAQIADARDESARREAEINAKARRV
jgi:hypothetical protein